MSDGTVINNAVIATYCLVVPNRVEVPNLTPLKSTELASLTRFLSDRSMSLDALLSVEDEEGRELLAQSELEWTRIADLVTRQGAVVLEIQRWLDMGIWIATRDDERYPSRWLQAFGDKSPPILFGVGESSLLERDAIAIVGSRNADEAGLAFTRDSARSFVKGGYAIVSGGARGIDRTAMSAAMENGGAAIGVMSDSLTRTLREAEVRQYLGEDQLTLVSPFRPDAGFHVGSAMGRNKLIYCLSTAAVVISTDSGKGGTWTGAIENLREGWVPLYVRDQDDAPEGNRVLLKQVQDGRRPVALNDVPEAGVLPDPAERSQDSPPQQLELVASS